MVFFRFAKLNVAMLLTLLVGTLFAPMALKAQVQAGLGAIAGVVQDKTKAAIPGAKVVLDNPGIGLHKEIITNGVGEYSFSPLEVVGGYTIQISAPGFTTEVVRNLTTSVGEVITQNVYLGVGSSNVVVDVQGTAEEQVQTDTSSVSQIIDKTIWQDSPLENRSQNNFVALTAGAAPGAAGRGFAVNGSRSGTGDFLVDGVDNNDQGLGGGAAGGAVTTISPDAIQEFRVVSSVPAAEYGRTGGFATDTVLKSGTKKFHGSAFEYNRGEYITANNWESDANGLRDHLVRNQFGGSIGGPVYKDRTFFYATVEFQRRRTGSPAAGIITTTSDFLNFVKSGAFETFMEGTTQQDPGIGQIGACPAQTGTSCPGILARSATLGSIFSELYAAEPESFPLATQPIAEGNVGEGLYTGPDTLANPIIFPVQVYGQTAVKSDDVFNENRGSLKLDHKLTDRDQLSFTYLADLNNDTSSTGGGNEDSPGVPELSYGGAQLFGATHTHTFSSTLVNVFKAGYLRHVNNIMADVPTGVPGIVPFDSLFTGFGSSSGLPQLFTENQFSYEDSVTKTAGRHTIKVGFSFKRTRNGSSFYNDGNGSIFPWSVEGLLTDGKSDSDLDNYFSEVFTGAPGPLFGALAAASASLNPTTGGAPNPYRGYRANEFAAYAQDDFKISPRLVLNYGIRWDYFGPPHNFQSGIDSNVYFGTATTAIPTGNPFLPNNPLLAGEEGATFQLAESHGRSTIWNRDTNNFAPRVGFSYDTFGNQKLVVRAGFGIGYDRLYNNVYENIRFNAPFFVDNTAGLDDGEAPISEAQRAALFTVPFTGNASVAGTGSAVPRHVDQNLVTAYYEQAHVGVETNLVHGYVLEVNYIGTFGRKLVGLKNINTFAGRVACPEVTTPYAVGSPCAVASASTGGLGFSEARPSNQFANDDFRTSSFSSNYNGGEISLRKGFSNGLQILANYTYSKSLDIISDVFNVKSGSTTGISDPYNPSYDYGPSDNDIRHNFVLTANYITHSSTHKLLLAGWGLSPILTLQAGSPIDVIDGHSNYDPNEDGVTGSQRAVYIGPGSIKNAIQHGVSPSAGYLKPGSFSGSDGKPSYTCPATVAFCNPPIGRNAITGPRLENLDLSVSKHISITEKYKLTVQAAFFDVFNHPEWANPVSTTNSGDFGQSTSAANRVGQLSGRIDF